MNLEIEFVDVVTLAKLLVKAKPPGWRRILRTLRQQAEYYAGGNLKHVDWPVADPAKQPLPTRAPNLDLWIETMDNVHLSLKCANALQQIGVKTVGDLIQYSTRELVKTGKFGLRSLKELRTQILEPMGLKLHD